MIRRILNRYLPEHFHDPIGLATRLIKTGDSAARFAMWTSALGIAASPFDMALSPLERRHVRRAPPRKLPLILVCGPPRSGTTLVYQALAQHLDVGYFSNVTALFPRAPLLASWLSRPYLRNREFGYHNFYGRTESLAGTNDALFLWDRWLGSNRIRIPNEISPAAGIAMRQFFAAAEEHFEKPLLNKVNNLNHLASLVSEYLENVYFICLSRSHLELAKSLYHARFDIHGSAGKPYGVTSEALEQCDPVESVCRQVVFLEEESRRQQMLLGDDKFWIVKYEDFCSNPMELIERVATEILGNPSAIQGEIPDSFVISQGKPVSQEILDQFESFFSRADTTCLPSSATQ